MRAHAKPAKLRDGTWGAKTECFVPGLSMAELIEANNEETTDGT